MLYLGIDIGKNTHVASLIDETAKPLFKAFSFSNTTEGANSLIEKLSVHINNQSEVEIGMEATVIIGFRFTHFLLKMDLLFMSLILFKLTAGEKGLKSESVKQISSILFSLLI